MDLIDDIYRKIASIKDLGSLKVEKILLSSPFSVIQLNDGSIGSSVNYKNQGIFMEEYDTEALERSLYEKLPEDPLLWKTLKEKKDLVSSSLKVSILSALSQSLLNKEILQKEQIIHKNISFHHDSSKLLENTKSILIIGEGGAYPHVLKLKIPNIVICDIKYKIPSRSMRAHKKLTENLLYYGYEGSISLITDNDLEKTTPNFDTLWITGSTLCNNSLIKLNHLFNRCKKVILQGPSCSVYPISLFDLGITDILTTIKSEEEVVAGDREDGFINAIVDKNYIHMSRP